MKIAIIIDDYVPDSLISFLKMGKLCLKNIKWLSQGHTAKKWQNGTETQTRVIQSPHTLSSHFQP